MVLFPENLRLSHKRKNFLPRISRLRTSPRKVFQNQNFPVPLLEEEKTRILFARVESIDFSDILAISSSNLSCPSNGYNSYFLIKAFRKSSIIDSFFFFFSISPQFLPFFFFLCFPINNYKIWKKCCKYPIIIPRELKRVFHITIIPILNVGTDCWITRLIYWKWRIYDRFFLRGLRSSIKKTRCSKLRN